MYKIEKNLLAVSVIMLIAAAAAAQDTNTNSLALAGGTTNRLARSAVVDRAGSFGLGPLLGEPMGVGAKLWLSDKTAVDAGAGWSLLDPEGFQFHRDFLFHKFNLFRAEQRDLPLFFGVGGHVKFVEHGDNRAGIRVPVGAKARGRFWITASLASPDPIAHPAQASLTSWMALKRQKRLRSGVTSP